MFSQPGSSTDDTGYPVLSTLEDGCDFLEWGGDQVGGEERCPYLLLPLYSAWGLGASVAERKELCAGYWGVSRARFQARGKQAKKTLVCSLKHSGYIHPTGEK